MNFTAKQRKPRTIIVTRGGLLKKYHDLSAPKKNEILWEALDYMQQYNGRTRWDCIFLAMGYYDTNDTDENGNKLYRKEV